MVLGFIPPQKGLGGFLGNLKFLNAPPLFFGRKRRKQEKKQMRPKKKVLALLCWLGKKTCRGFNKKNFLNTSFMRREQGFVNKKKRARDWVPPNKPPHFWGCLLPNHWVYNYPKIWWVLFLKTGKIPTFSCPTQNEKFCAKSTNKMQKRKKIKARHYKYNPQISLVLKKNQETPGWFFKNLTYL